MNTPQRILIVDDDPRLQTVVQTALAEQGYDPAGAEDGPTAVRLYQQHEPHLVMLDIAMPGMDGFQVLERLRQLGDTPVIMLTTRWAEDDKIRAFELGADDYLTKPFSARELLARVRAVLHRTYPSEIDTASIIAGDLRLDRTSRQVWVGARRVALSPIEFNLLTELAQSPGRVIPDRHMLVRVWGEGYEDDKEILRLAVCRLRQRLEPDPDEPRYILRRQSVGYWLQINPREP